MTVVVEWLIMNSWLLELSLQIFEFLIITYNVHKTKTETIFLTFGLQFNELTS